MYLFLKYGDRLAKYMSQNLGQLTTGTSLKDLQTRDELHKL